MACSIIRTPTGEISQVLTEEGVPSELYNQIASFPFVMNGEEALNLYLQIQSADVSTKLNELTGVQRFFSGEPTLTFKAYSGYPPNYSFSKYEEALRYSNGEAITLGFQGQSDFVPVQEFNSDLRSDTELGKINTLILNRILAPKKVKIGNEMYLIGAGDNIGTIINNNNEAIQILNSTTNSYVIDDVNVIRPRGNKEISLIDSSNFSLELNKKYNSYSTGTDLSNFDKKFNQDLQKIKEEAITAGNFMLAPNGIKTNLNERNWLVTRHPNFINWFGDFINNPTTSSRVVDENGDPQIVYHGSNNSGFVEFIKTDDFGYFFSDSLTMARSYSSSNADTELKMAKTFDEAVSKLEAMGGEMTEIYVALGDDFDSIDEVMEEYPDFEVADIRKEYDIYDRTGSLLDRAENEDAAIIVVNNTEYLDPGITEHFLNLRNPLDLEGSGDNWDDISGVVKSELSLGLELNEETNKFEFTDYDGGVTEYDTFIEAFQDIERLQPEFSDEIKTQYDKYGSATYAYEGDAMTGEQAPYGQSTREWVRESMDMDADGTIFRNITDEGPHGGQVEATVYVAMDSNNIKSTDNLGTFNGTNNDMRFSIGTNGFQIKESLTPIIERLKESGLAENIELGTTESISELVGEKYKINEGVKGLVIGNRVVLNSDSMTLDTPVHEMGHLWNSYTKQNNPELYNQGLALVKSQGQTYIEIAQSTQPNLSGEALYEEALAQAIGDNGAKLIAEQATGLKGWLEKLWNYISDAIGISSMSSTDLQSLSLDEFATAVAIDLLKGNTVGGLEQVEPGEGGILTPKKLRQPVVATDVKIETSNYPAEFTTELPRMTLKEIIAKYKGKIYITTSDATTIGLDENGDLIQGGPGYLTLTENVEAGIGFAALDAQGARAMSSKVFKIGKGDPVAVLVMVQNPSSTLGNAYGGDYFFNGIKQVLESQSMTKNKALMKSLNKVVTRYFDKYVKDSKKKGFIAKEHRQKVLDAFININSTSVEQFHSVFINDTNFEFRRMFLKDLIYGQDIKSLTPEINVVKQALKTNGFTYQRFVDLYMDKGVVNTSNIESDKLGIIIGGFEMRTDLKDNKAMTDYTDVAQSRGVKHKMFNGKVPSEGNFLTDVGYPVDENFADYSKTNTQIKPEFVEAVNTLIPEWNSSSKIGKTYTSLSTQESIKFKAYLAINYPEMLETTKGAPSRDVARGMGFRTDDNTPNRMTEDFLGVRFSIAEGNKLFNNPLPIVTEIEEEYVNSKGIPYEDFKGIRKIDTNQSKVIADLFDALVPSPESPETQAAYNAMIEETIEQYKTIISHGYVVEINNSEPYSSSGEMISDLRNNKKMNIFSTESGFGDEAITEEQRSKNPLLLDSGFKDVNGETLLANDVFRFVHDFFGHAKLGNGFGAVGEENAWQVHARMYTPLARRAMTTETRGQNSWVNFSGVNDAVFQKRDEARKLRTEGKIEEAEKLVGEVYDEMSFADQKVGLLPEWVSDPNSDLSFASPLFKTQTPEVMATLMGMKKGSGTAIADSQGKFLYGKGESFSMKKLFNREDLNIAEKALLDWYGNGWVRMFGARSMYEGIVMYNSNTKEIVVNANNPLGAIHFSDQKALESTMLHEIIHAYIDKKTGANNGANRVAFNEELSKLRETLSANKERADFYVQRMIQHIEAGTPEEMVTYLLTDERVAKFMASIPYETVNNQKSLWGKFLDMVSNLLSGTTLKDAVINVMDKYAPLNQEGPYTREDVYQTTDAEAFSTAMKDAMNNRKESAAQLKPVSTEDAQSILDKGGKLFLTSDGKAGAYVEADGYMGGLFRNPTSTRTQAAKILQEIRVEQGGKFFDAFGETSEVHLESTYIKNGFIPLVRMDFSEEIAPNNWEQGSLKTRPDNVFFVYAPGVAAEVGDGIRENDFTKAYSMAENFNPETDVLEKKNPIENSNLGENLLNDLQQGGEINPIDC